MMEIPVHDRTGRVVETIQFDEACLGKTVRKALLHQAIVGHEANQRVGTASSKTRSEVMGHKQKPWRQKGTGRARSGTRQSPVWRGGGVAHGPRPRQFTKRLPRKARRAALQSALLGKLRDGEIKVVTDLDFGAPKTKEMASTLKALEVAGSCLVVVAKRDEKAWKSARNLPHVDMLELREVNAYQALVRQTLLMTKAAFSALPEEFK